VKGLKESGYYADGGNLYLQVTNASESDQFNQGGESSLARTPRARLTAVIPGAHHDPSLRSPKGVNVAKSWVFRFTLAGRTRDMGLGKYPVVTLDKARELAGRCRQQVAAGVDPITARDRERKAAQVAAAKGRTFEQCATTYIETHAPSWVNAKHQQQWTNTLKIYAYPLLGKLPVGISTPTW
jgi:Arm DNA-binding domain